MALVDIPHSQLEALGYTDGNLHELRWEIRVGDGFSHPGAVKVWIDDVFVAESNTTGVNNRLEGGNWTSTRAGGFGRVSNQICRGESSDSWPYETGSSLLYHYGTGFMVDQNFVFEDKTFNGQIDFTGPVIDQKSGGMTGTDTMGGLWYGTLHIGNDTFLRSGQNTFGTRSDDGSALWIDLDRDGDFSRTNANNLDEMVVNNLGNHGSRNRVGTVFLGYKSPILMRVGGRTNPGISAGTGGVSTAFHSTDQGEHLAIGTDKLREKNWNHLALVVNRLDGEVRHFLNGRLVGSDDFTEGIYGDFHLGDWYLGGIPGLSDFNGSIDDARIYSSALSDEDIAFIYNGGAGDMGVVGIVDSPNITLDNPISVNLRFSKVGSGVIVSGLEESEINGALSGGTIVPGSFVSNDGNQTFSFQIVPDADALEIDLSLPGGAGSFDGEPTLAIYKTIGIVPEVLARDQISNWWWFNEGLGDMATDSIGDNHGSLIGGAGWAADAIEGTSVEFEKPSQMIDMGSVSLSPFNPGLFQLSFWFKRKNEAFTWSTEQISNVMVSMGDENSSTLQIGTNGQTVEVFMDTAVRSQRISIGSGVAKNQWHHLMVSYDENATDGYELKVYLDGQLSGYSSDLGGILQVKASDYWLLGAASKISPTNGRFIGLIDDMRFYTTQEAEKISSENYSNGSGDLQLSVNVSHPASTHDNPIFADLTFRKYGVDYPIADFNSSRITIRGGRSDWRKRFGCLPKDRIQFNC